MTSSPSAFTSALIAGARVVVGVTVATAIGAALAELLIRWLLA